MCDAVIPPQKDELIADADKQVSQVNKLFNRGLISENERYTQTINIWQATTDKVSKALAANLPKDNSSSCSHDRKVVVKQQADPLSTVFCMGTRFSQKRSQSYDSTLYEKVKQK